MNACKSLYVLTQDVFFCGKEIEGVIFETFKWDFIYIAISILICIAYSSIACEMYARTTSRKRNDSKHIIKTGSVYGLGIFSMHFMGMFALIYPGPMQYDALITLFSLIVAISGVSLSLWLVQRRAPLVLSGLIFGLTVCLMHYAGMLSIVSNPFHMHHNLNLMVLAAIYSVAGSMLSISFIIKYLKKKNRKRVLLLGATVMGLTISGVHYLAMASLEFSVNSSFIDFPHAWFLHRHSIIGFTFLLLILTISIYIRDRINAEIKLTKSQKDLEDKNESLEEALLKVQNMQSQLVESEKMASLGQLVSGVAHEINTPVGICITSASYLKDKADIFFKKFFDSTLTKSDFEAFMSDVNSGSELVASNLSKASALIKNFKQVAVDQSADEVRDFYLKQYIEEVLTSLNHKIKNTHFDVHIVCEKDFQVKTYAGSISTVITHLFNNSLIHGFEGMKTGSINIKVEDCDDTAKITFTDNGSGMCNDGIENITNPFYTTKRGEDCSGLGMYIVYNQTTQKL